MGSARTGAGRGSRARNGRRPARGAGQQPFVPPAHLSPGPDRLGALCPRRPNDRLRRGLGRRAAAPLHHSPRERGVAPARASGGGHPLHLGLRGDGDLVGEELRRVVGGPGNAGVACPWPAGRRAKCWKTYSSSRRRISSFGTAKRRSTMRVKASNCGFAIAQHDTRSQLPCVRHQQSEYCLSNNLDTLSEAPKVMQQKREPLGCWDRQDSPFQPEVGALLPQSSQRLYTRSVDRGLFLSRIQNEGTHKRVSRAAHLSQNSIHRGGFPPSIPLTGFVILQVPQVSPAFRV